MDNVLLLSYDAVPFPQGKELYISIRLLEVWLNRCGCGAYWMGWTFTVYVPSRTPWMHESAVALLQNVIKVKYALTELEHCR
jgi:hypothetical protein